MDKYKKLISNTIIFAIGTFSSKLLVFLLMPFFTRVLTKMEYGSVDLIVQAGNLLLPLVTIGIINAIIRFGLDNSYRKSDVFSTGIVTIMVGFLVLVLFAPLLSRIQYIRGHTMLIYAFVLMSSVRSLCAQFVRARGLVRLYAVDGILSTLTTVLFNVLYLAVLRWGVLGYVLAIVSADFCSAIFLIFAAKLYRYVHIKSIRWETSAAMLRYAIPMIPTTMFWWITNVSDRYMISAFLGNDFNGLYAASSKVPTMMTLISTIFMDAWQMSSVTENSNERESFFSKVFHSYQPLLFTAASGLILCCKLMTKILVSNAFYDSWLSIPYLVMATTFSCMVSFMGSVYVVEKRSVNALATTAMGTVINIVLNLLMIPRMGVNGAALATLLSYLLIFLVRVVDTRRFIRIHINAPRLVFDTLLLLVQSLLMIAEVPHWVWYELFLTGVMVLTNMGAILVSLKKLLHRKHMP